MTNQSNIDLTYLGTLGMAEAIAELTKLLRPPIQRVAEASGYSAEVIITELFNSLKTAQSQLDKDNDLAPGCSFQIMSAYKYLDIFNLDEGSLDWYYRQIKDGKFRRNALGDLSRIDRGGLVLAILAHECGQAFDLLRRCRLKPDNKNFLNEKLLLKRKVHLLDIAKRANPRWQHTLKKLTDVSGSKEPLMIYTYAQLRNAVVDAGAVPTARDMEENDD